MNHSVNGATCGKCGDGWGPGHRCVRLGEPLFDIGDVVELRSGGPPMTVRAVERHMADCGHEAVCTWMDDDDRLVVASFDEQMLEPWEEGDRGPVVHDVQLSGMGPGEEPSVTITYACPHGTTPEFCAICAVPEVRQSAGRQSATIAPGVVYIPPGTPPDPYATAPLTPPPRRLAVAVDPGRDDRAATVLILGEEWVDQSPAQRKEQLARAVREGLDRRARAEFEVEADERLAQLRRDKERELRATMRKASADPVMMPAPGPVPSCARCGDCTCNGECKPATAIAAETPRCPHGVPKDRVCGVCDPGTWARRFGEMLQLEGSQPSAVASAPAARPRFTVCAQSQYDPDE